jgi:hypothetical protein
MASRWFTITVVLFWLGTMTWLVDQKILPSWRIGEPPNYRTMFGTTAATAAVGWTISVDGHNLGWAISCLDPLEQGGSQLRSRIQLVRLPLATMTPGWMASFVRMVEQAGNVPELSMDIDASSLISLDTLSQPVEFRALADIGYGGQLSYFEPGMRISVRGVVEGSYLRLVVRTGDNVSRTRVYLPSGALLGDSLSPHGRLPGLRIGQTWAVPAYSPFRPPNSPLEVLHATVEERESIHWDGRAVPTLLVTLRSDAGSGLTTAQNVRGRMWVAADGMVLRQDLLLNGSRLSFERVAARSPADRKPLDELAPWWKGSLPKRPTRPIVQPPAVGN